MLSPRIRGTKDKAKKPNKHKNRDNLLKLGQNSRTLVILTKPRQQFLPGLSRLGLLIWVSAPEMGCDISQRRENCKFQLLGLTSRGHSWSRSVHLHGGV